MSHWDNLDHYEGNDEWWDEWGGFGCRPCVAKPLICKHCGAKGLRWSEVKPGVFRLFDPELRAVHRCPAANDFK